MAETFSQVVTEAVADIEEHGYDSEERIAFWLGKIRAAAEGAMLTPEQMQAKLRDALVSIYRQMVEKKGIVSMHPGIGRFTIEQVRPQLRAELDRRIMASANLIKLNRKQAIEKTLQRFSGWSTSIPKGGSKNVKTNDVKKDIRKALQRLPFEERRVLVDQGHKFTSSLSETLAQDGGAIAGAWHSNWRQPNYDYREDHKERDRLVYAVRGCWALERGLMKPSKHGYTDDITKPAEEPFCRCKYRWIYNLRDLPRDMLTAKGRDELSKARKVTNAA